LGAQTAGGDFQLPYRWLVDVSWLCLFDILHYFITISTSVVRKDIGMKLVLLSILLIMSLSAAAQRQISYIDNAGSWIHVWDKTGKRLATRPAN
jgi:hypothetical protein